MGMGVYGAALLQAPLSQCGFIEIAMERRVRPARLDRGRSRPAAGAAACRQVACRNGANAARRAHDGNRTRVSALAAVAIDHGSTTVCARMTSRQPAGERAYFFSAPGGGFGAPTLSISGCIFSEVVGAWPVVAGSGALASGMVAAGGRSGVPVRGLFAAGGAAVGLAASGKSRVGV